MSSSSNNNGIRRNHPRGTSSSQSNSSSSASNSDNLTSNGRSSRSSRVKNQANLLKDDSDDSDEVKQISSKSGSSSSSSSNNNFGKSSFLSNGTASATKLDMEAVTKLETITGLSKTLAIELLERSNNKLDKALDHYFNPPEKNKSKIDTNSSTNQTKFGTKRNYNRINGNNNNFDDTSNSSDPYVSIVDDNTNDSVDVDDVRAPIPQKIEKLLDYDPYALALAPQSKRMRSAFDGYRNGEEEALSYSANSSSRAKSLAILFRPPIDLLFNGSFEASKIQGCKTNKWVLVNVQNQAEFHCQSLNRDVWRDETVKEIVRENFIFVQIYFDSLDGKKLINYYNITKYPFVAILDPRTGEKLMSFTSNKIDQLMFCEKVTTFLADYDVPIKDFEAQNKNSNEIIKVDDEDDIVELNNANSKTGNTNKPKKANEILGSITNGVDDDEVEIEDNDILSTDGSNSNNSDFGNKVKNKTNRKKVEIEDEADVNVDEVSNDYSDVVISKEKYNKEKLEKAQLLNEKNQNKSTNELNDSISNINKQANLLSANVPLSTINLQPTQTRYETPDTGSKDCILRILYPNGNRLDFCTNGDSKIKLLIDYLTNQGYKKNLHELIERLMPNIAYKNTATTSSDSSTLLKSTNDTDMTNQSRNLFNSDQDLTFKQLKLYPRVFLLLQES